MSKALHLKLEIRPVWIGWWVNVCLKGQAKPLHRVWFPTRASAESWTRKERE